MIRVLLVDDEPLALERVATLLSRETDVEIVGQCQDGRDALDSIRKLKPDLVFLDIQMPEMDGFDVLAGLDSDAMPLIIFITAYDHYAIQAFSVHAFDYLLKPFDGARFQEALQRARQNLDHKDEAGLQGRIAAVLEEMGRRRPVLNRFVIRNPDRIIVIKAEEVECIESTGNYMHLYRGKESFIIRETLQSLEARLDPQVYLRTHRSWIVNVEKIKEIQPWSKGSYLLITMSGLKVPVSHHFKDRVEDWLRNQG